MASTKYTYSIAGDTANGVFDSMRFVSEVNGSAIVTALDHIDTSSDVLDIWFKAALSGGDETVLAGLVAAHAGVALSSVDLVQIANGRVPTGKASVTRCTIYTSNWCDKTTWYQEATRVVDEVTTDSGDHTTYNLEHTHVIDTYHGKITQEDFLVDGDSNSYRVVVKVDSEVQTEQDPHLGTGGDYTVNYSAGTITFLAALAGTETVEFTYHYAGSATFTIKPNAGKALKMDITEVQFSVDVELTDSVKFQAYGFVDVFAPELTPTPYPSGTLIPLGDPNVYKTMQDFLNDSVRTYPQYKAFGGFGWRGMSADSCVMDWDYVSSTFLSSAAGMEIRISLEHDVEFGGTFATASIYCIVEDE